MRIEDMNEGVQILLARMETHPEEFMSNGKWHFVNDAIKQERLGFLYPEEVEALTKGLREVHREKFTSTVLKKLTETGQGELF